MRPVDDLSYGASDIVSRRLSYRLAVAFDMAFKLVQVVFKLGILQSLHNQGAGPGNPEVLTRFYDVIFQITFLGDPQSTIQATDHIPAPVAFEVP
jgi:hypothetical protein